jgi:hypothetical protein
MTYCMSILMKIRQANPELIVKEVEYTANSLLAQVAYQDQDYTIEIKPKTCQHITKINLGPELICLDCGKVFHGSPI